MRRKFVWTVAAIVVTLVPLAARAQEPPGGAEGGANRPSPRGLADAPVHVVAFCDFESEPCGRIAVVLAGVLRDRPDQVRIEFRHRAGEGQVISPFAYQAALAAGSQGRFWEMHDMLFANQDRLTRADFAGMAAQLGLDVPSFTAELDSDVHRAQVEADAAEAARLGITGTPALVVNGTVVPRVKSRADIDAAIEQVKR